MADIPQNPFDQQALDRLEDAVDLSRALVDNANQLRNALRTSGQILDKEFNSATKSISKRLNDIATQFKKLSVDEFKRSDAIKAQTKLADDLTNLAREKKRIEDSILPTVRQQYQDTKSTYDTLRQQLGTKQHLTVAEQEQLNIAKQAFEEAKQSLTVTNDTLQVTEQLTLATQEQNDQLETYIQRWNQVNLQMGLFGKAFKGLKKIPILGDLLNADKALKEMEKSALAGENAFKTMGKGISAAFEGIEKSTVILAAISAIVKVVRFFIDAMFEADKQITDIARNMSITKDQAAKVRQEMFYTAENADKFATLARGVVVSEREIYETQMAFNDAFGTTLQLNSQMITQLAVAKNMIKLSEDAMYGLSQAALLTGEEVEGIEKTILGTSKIQQINSRLFLNDRKVLESVLKLTGGIRLNFKGSYEAMSLAVTKAIQMGTTLEKVDATASSLLDFESSIQAQMESEVLTGKQLNLDRARYAALTGDTNTLMEEMVKNIGDYNEYAVMNRIQQEASAKALGMSRDDMADMLLQQTALNRLTKIAGFDAQKTLIENYNNLKAQGKLTKEITADLGERALLALETQSAQEKFAKALEKAKEAFTKLVDGGMIDKLANIVTDMVTVIGKSGFGGLFSIFGKSEFQKQQEASEKARAGETVKTLEAKPSLTAEEKQELETAKNVLKAVHGAKENYLSGLGQSYNYSVKDFTIKTLPEDTISMAGGTKLGRTDEMVAELKQQNRLLAALLAKDQTISIDGQKVANVVASNVPTAYGNLLNPGTNPYS